MRHGASVLRPLAVVRERAEFRKLWIGDLASKAGSSVTNLALPLTAAVTLDATPIEMGILAATGTLPNLLLGLPAGVIVDRLRRRPILIVADLCQALLLASIPVAAVFDVLRIEQLYVVAFLVTAFSLFSDIAATSLMPVVLGRATLLDGNIALTLNGQIAKVAGPSLAGSLIALLTAPIVIALDAVSFVVSAWCSVALRVSEPKRDERSGSTRTSLWAELVEGVKVVMQDAMLRSIVGASILGTLAGSVQAPLLFLFLTRQLDLSAAVIGLVMSTGGVAAIGGSLLARPAANRLGQGHATAGGTLLVSIGMLLIPLADGPLPLVLALLILSQCLIGAGVPIYSINQLTIRQSVVPNHLQGRTNATRRFLMFGAAPFGALLSGSLGGVLGVRPVLFVGGLLMATALIWTVRSPLFPMRQIE